MLTASDGWRRPLKQAIKSGSTPKMSPHSAQAASQITADSGPMKSLKQCHHMLTNCSSLQLSIITWFNMCLYQTPLTTILYRGNQIRHHYQSLWMIMRNGMWRKSWIPEYTDAGCSTWLNGLDLTGLIGSLTKALINWKQSTDSISVTLKSQDHFLRTKTKPQGLQSQRGGNVMVHITQYQSLYHVTHPGRVMTKSTRDD